jgi:hypothetical protein
MLGFRVRGSSGKAVPKLVRTSPPGWAGAAAGVDSITYSGSYPVSRLAIKDATLPNGFSPSLYAYSTLKPGDMEASGLPAVAFSLALDNTAGTSAVTVDFMVRVRALSACPSVGVLVIMCAWGVDCS